MFGVEDTMPECGAIGRRPDHPETGRAITISDAPRAAATPPPAAGLRPAQGLSVTQQLCAHRAGACRSQMPTEMDASGWTPHRLAEAIGCRQQNPILRQATEKLQHANYQFSPRIDKSAKIWDAHRRAARTEDGGKEGAKYMEEDNHGRLNLCTEFIARAVSLSG